MEPHTVSMDHTEIPIIDTGEPLFDVLPKLFNFISMAVGDMAYTFEQMMYGSQGHRLRQLVHALAEDSHNPFIIVALMILKWEFDTAVEDDWGLNESRGAACEFVAWQFLCHLNQHETIEFLLEELPIPRRNSANSIEAEADTSGLTSRGGTHNTESETTPLLLNSSSLSRLFGGRANEAGSTGNSQGANSQDETYAAQRYSQFFGLNALEIATIAHAKRFLSQRVVQRVVDDIWNGEIVFWDSLTVHSTKKPQLFNRRTADPYSRLRVPIYRKVFEAAFFVSFLFLYYAVLVERKQDAVGVFEAVMYVWIVAFAYDELSGIIDAGVVFYQMDFWSLWNISIIGVGMAFVITRVIGLVKGDNPMIELSFDILSLEALFLVPRICSLVSLNSYFGSLIPVLKEMTKAFFRFFPVVVVLYIGFLTTFTMLARDRLSLDTMSHLLVKVFFGSSVLGLDTASEISPIFGYGLMLIFALMTNTLILSSLISLMSMSLEGVMRHAREEYLFQLAIYVLESSNSRRLTYFMPPLNLIPLLCIRPMRIFLSAGTVRRVRIVLLRATHLPFVALIWAYESKWRHPRRHNSRLPPMSARAYRTSANEATLSRCQDPHHPSVSIVGTSLGPGKGRRVDQQAARESGMERRQTPFTDLIDTIERLRAQVDAIAARD
ncbi:uncharacterized protein N7446_010967 [Penicillium canescens]|uniref:Calcium channel YVC1-like C-terminal transmembrane domain-containing protein n=1 Tax=Penicillium canescens TaxID=5083 RepID=A0AAD6IHJ1_PENCN|nr:uncharacterized protein N7446_010967 [Penicillium canescens]KAJ6048113.1 hypothetical protein N7460_004260 [Penicillium canescens]KAJ6048284.1 hypothetical protein N7446_010967 [Penicillium canescens]